MNNELYEQAKQAVAVKHGFKDWNRLIIFGNSLPDLYYAEAADLYAQQVANEAVKADRKYLEDNTHKVMRYAPLEANTIGGNGILFSWPLLPFPEQ